MCRGFVGVSLLLLTVGLAPAKEVVWQKAVYSDARYATAWQGNSDATRDALVAAGYTLLNADELKTWMTARIADKAFSVVVFCRDSAPDTVTETMSSSCTLRRYLDTGGKIVWYGDIPFYYQSNSSATNTTWGDSGAPAILGFNTSSAPRDSGNTSIITPLGTAWGLTATWTSQRPAVPTITADLEVLAKDNAGNACAWVKHYMPNDTFRGFVRFRDTGGQAVVEDIIRVAEYVSEKAWNPAPADGETAVLAPLITWNSGPFALWHDVYFGTNPTPGEAEHIGQQMFTMYYHVAGLQPGQTYYWRIDEIEADGTVSTGDVWSFVAQDLKAYHPSPAEGATDAPLTPVLAWLPGQGAVKHRVYLGDDADAVLQGTAGTDKGEVTDPTFAAGALDSLATYYWRVDETVTDGTVRSGSVWTFTTCLSVDDFESYTDDEGSRIYETWIDGWINGTGATVGNTTAPFAEQTIVHNGLQSMPLDYNNINAPFYSEAELDFAPTQDWTVGGVSDLALYFRGAAANGAGTLYVAVEDSSGQVAVVTNPTAAAVTVTPWTQWKIPLSSLTGVNLAKVKAFYLGVGDRQAPAQGGAGRLYIDDIQVIK
jgi:hypothetical protein